MILQALHRHKRTNNSLRSRIFLRHGTEQSRKKLYFIKLFLLYIITIITLCNWESGNRPPAVKSKCRLIWILPPPHLHMRYPPYLSHSTSSLSVASNQLIQAEGGGGQVDDSEKSVASSNTTPSTLKSPLSLSSVFRFRFSIAHISDFPTVNLINFFLA